MKPELIQLAEHQTIWLKYILSKFNNGVKPSFRRACVDLKNEVPADFEPFSIHRTLLAYGTDITLLGIWQLDRSSPWVGCADRVIKCIQTTLLSNPDQSAFQADAIANQVGIPKNDVVKVLELFGHMRYWNNRDGGGSNEVTVHVQGDLEFKKFLRYKGIEQALAEFQDESKREESRWNFPPSQVEANSLVQSKTQHVPNTAFIMMWMDSRGHPELDDTKNTIKDVCKVFEIDASRVDDIQHSESITDLVLQKIRDSEFLIADLTGERPNVYYEIGYAHAIGKHPVLFCKEGTKIHFDLSVHNVRQYRNLTELKEILITRFEALLGKKLVAG